MAASAADLPASLFSADTVVVLQMEVPFAQSLEVARRTKSASGTVIWNLAPVPEQMTSVMVRDLLAATDYLLVNEHEALDAAAAIGVPVSGFRSGSRRTRKGRRTDLCRDSRRARRVCGDSQRRSLASSHPEHYTRRHHWRRRHLRRSVCIHAGRASAASKSHGGRVRGCRLEMPSTRSPARYADQGCDQIDYPMRWLTAKSARYDLLDWPPCEESRRFKPTASCGQSLMG